MPVPWTGALTGVVATGGIKPMAEGTENDPMPFFYSITSTLQIYSFTVQLLKHSTLIIADPFFSVWEVWMSLSDRLQRK